MICFHFDFEALEKNQQWLVYDQQREAYVKGLLAKIFELEQKSETAAHSLPQQTKKAESEGTGIKMFFWGRPARHFPKGEIHQLQIFINVLESELSKSYNSEVRKTMLASLFSHCFLKKGDRGTG